MASPVPLPLRLLLIPAFAFGVFLAYAYGLAFFDSVIPRPQDRSLVFAALLAEGFAAAALVSLVFSYPLAFVYGRPAALAATAVALPVLFLRCVIAGESSVDAMVSYILNSVLKKFVKEEGLAKTKVNFG